MRAAPDATSRDIELHQHTARVMGRYGGVLGRIRVAEAKIAKVLNIKGHPRPGSKAWEAQHEIYKLKQINYDLSERIKTANPTEASQLEAQLINIQSQLREHIKTFERGDDADGAGYVAMAEKPTQQKEDLKAIIKQLGSKQYSSIIGKLGTIDQAGKILEKVALKVGSNSQLRVELTTKIFNEIDKRANLLPQEIDLILEPFMNSEANSPENLQQAQAREQEILKEAEVKGLSKIKEELDDDKKKLKKLKAEQIKNQNEIDYPHEYPSSNSDESENIFKKRDRLKKEIKETNQRIKDNQPFLDVLEKQQHLNEIQQAESGKRNNSQSVTKDKNTLESKDNLSKKQRELTKDEQKKYEEYRAYIEKADREFQQIAKFRNKAGLPPYTTGAKEEGAVASVKINESTYFGVNTGFQTSKEAKRRLRREAFDKIIKSDQTKEQKLTWAKNWSHLEFLKHAEAHALLRAAERNNGKLPEEITMHVDKKTCRWCIKYLPYLMKELEIKKLIIYSGQNTKPIILE